MNREGFLLLAVHYGRYPSTTTQFTGGSLASPVARFGGQRQLFAHFACSLIKLRPATPPGMTMAWGGAPIGERRSQVKVASVDPLRPYPQVRKPHLDAITAGEMAGADGDKDGPRLL